MRALDLFCGGGGAALGLLRAGFEVVGIDEDLRCARAYPGRFIQADCFRLPVALADFDLVWASPPCQRYSAQLRNNPNVRHQHPDLIGQTRMLLSSGPEDLLTVIENVPGSPLIPSLRLTGGQVGLPLIHRKRLFEMNFMVLAPPVTSKPNPLVSVSTTGGIGSRSRAARLRIGKNPFRYTRAEQIEAMGLPSDIKMTMRQIGNAVPPAYSEYIGRAAKRILERIGG